MVQGVGDKRKLPAEEASLTFIGRKGQAAQNPGVHGRGGSYLQAGGHEDLDGWTSSLPSLQACPSSYLLCWLGHKVIPQGTEDKAQGIPELVAEMAVVQDLRDRQVQVAPLGGKNKESAQPQAVGLSTETPSAILHTKAYPGFHGSIVQISGHPSHTRGSRKESPFSAAKGRQVWPVP